MYLATDGPELAHGGNAIASALDFNSTKDEKGWVGFTHENDLYYIQQIEPHTVWKVSSSDGSTERMYETSAPSLEELATRVSIQGSATAVRYTEDLYLALIQTRSTDHSYTTLALPLIPI